MIKLKVTILLILLATQGKGQFHISTDTLECKNNSKTSNEVIILGGDSLSSTFFITIPVEVKPHYHAFHSEVAFIIEGRGRMILGVKEFKIKKGDIIIIPRGTKHSVTREGRKPLKVISVQSPHFDGSDRVMIMK